MSCGNNSKVIFMPVETSTMLSSVNMKKEFAMRSATRLLALTLCACLALCTLSTDHAYMQGQAGGEALVRCDVRAYVADQDPKGMNVRSGPGNSYKIIGNLPNHDVEGIRVHITGARGDWVRIDLAVEEGGAEDRTFFQGAGWLYGPLLGVDGVGWIASGTKLYEEPMLRSRVLGRMPGGGESAVVRGCRGEWMYVEHKKVRGWAAPGTLCSNPLTTCS
jgi:SH3-like domain-containing protein